MKKVLVFCMLLALALSLDGSSVWAVEVGWMQKGVRIWYFGGAGLASGSSDAEEAYLINAVNGDNVQVTKHSAINHWGSPNPIDTETYSFADIGDPQHPNGPFWIHPQTLQSLVEGNYWKGLEIVTVYRHTYTYDTLPADLLHLLPTKALFDLTTQRQLVKLVYMLPYSISGTAYFDAETGLCLFYTQSTGGVTVFFILSEINYDFATQRAFAEDNGPHTGFQSFVSEQQISTAINTVLIQSSVETRYGGTVEMWVSNMNCGPKNYGTCSNYPNENYCFFGDIPILRHINMAVTPMPPPEQWNAYGQYLWWWVPKGALQNSTINVFGVPMARTSTNPYIFTATQQPAGLFFSKLWFDNDGYMTAFAAKDSTTGLDIDPGYTASYYTNSTTVYGLDYYKNTMGRATPIQITSPLYVNFPGYGLYSWNGSAWTPLTGDHPASGMVVSGSTLYADFASYGLYTWDGSTWTHLTGDHPASGMVVSGSTLYADFLGLGLYSWNGSAWTHLTGDHPASGMVISGSTLYADFPGAGLYSWNGSAWTQLTGDHPASMVISGSTLYADFAGYGLYSWNGSAWTQLTGDHPASMVISGSTLYADFAGYGLYSWNGSAWTQLTGDHPASTAVSGSTLYADFPGYGLYSWNGSAWTQLTGDHPASMVASGSTLYADFPGYGLYSWNGSAWTQLTGDHPASMVVGF